MPDTLEIVCVSILGLRANHTGKWNMHGNSSRPGEGPNNILRRVIREHATSHHDGVIPFPCAFVESKRYNLAARDSGVGTLGPHGCEAQDLGKDGMWRMRQRPEAAYV